MKYLLSLLALCAIALAATQIVQAPSTPETWGSPPGPDMSTMPAWPPPFVGVFVGRNGDIDYFAGPMFDQNGNPFYVNDKDGSGTINAGDEVLLFGDNHNDGDAEDTGDVAQTQVVGQPGSTHTYGNSSG